MRLLGKWYEGGGNGGRIRLSTIVTVNQMLFCFMVEEETTDDVFIL